MGLLQPRLLDLHGASQYTSLSERLVRELLTNGTLPRVRVPLPDGGEVRKNLLDRLVLDRLVDAWGEADGAAVPEAAAKPGGSL